MSEEIISIEMQIKCAERELAMRRRVYPRQVEAGRMKEDTATHEILAMSAIVRTLLVFSAQKELSFELPREN